MYTYRTRLMIATAVLAGLGGAVPVWAEDLPSDDRIQSGKLKNGVTWLLRQHDNPKGRLALMIHVDSGSLNETDAQRGLAHFMEHMVFNGTEHFPPGALVPYFESVGMEFGADLNAFTSFDQTAYMLFLPDTETERMDTAFKVLSDYAFRALLNDEEINKERGVILAEARTGKSAEQRMRDKLWPELYAGSRFAERLPIGDEEVIANAPRSEFVDYYRTWYRPEHVTVLIVGDVAPDALVPLVDKWFGAYEAPVPARPQRGPEFKPFREPRALVVTDPEATGCSVQLLTLRPGRPPTTSVEQRRVELVESIGTWIVARRYRERVEKGEANYRNARASVSDEFNDALEVSASASGEPEDWSKMLPELVAEVKRAREFGFTERELELAVKERLANAERAVRTEATTDARMFLFAMLRAVNDKVPALSAQQELELYQRLLPTITLAEVNRAFQEHFTPGTFAYVVELPEKEGVAVPTRDEILSVGQAAWAQVVEPLDQTAGPQKILAADPAPGQVTERSTDADLGITSLTLSNGVRVHHRFMDYRADTVMISISLAGGGIEETKENVGVTDVAQLVFNEPATSRLSATEIRDLMTGKNIRVGGAGGGGRRGRGGRGGGGGGARGEDAVTLSISGSPEELEAGMQLAHALLTDGRIEESAFRNWKLGTLERLERMQTMPRFKAMEALAEMLAGGDARLRMQTKEDVERQTVAAAQAWYDRLCREAPIEVAVVGEIQLDAVLPLIERYVGSLPARPQSAERLDPLRRVKRGAGPFDRHMEVPSITPQGMAMAGFLAADGKHAEERRALELAAQVVSTRLVQEIREDRGQVYSIRASYRPAWAYEDSAQFSAGAPCDPEEAQVVAAAIHKLFAGFAELGPTDGELENAKKQIANNLDTEMQEPAYWLRVLQHHDLHHRDLAEEKAEKGAFERLTAEEVRGVFAKYYTPARRYTVTAVPTGEELKAE